MKVYVQHRLAKFQAVQYRSRGSHLYVLCRSVCEWDQNWYTRSMPFLRADQGIKVTTELQTKNQAINSNDQVIKHTFGNQKSWSQALQQVTWKWLPLATPGTSSHSLISKPLVSDDWKTCEIYLSSLLWTKGSWLVHSYVNASKLDQPLLLDPAHFPPKAIINPMIKQTSEAT